MYIENKSLADAFMTFNRTAYDQGNYETDESGNLFADTWKTSKSISLLASCLEMVKLDSYKCFHIFDILVLNHVYNVDNMDYNIDYKELVFPLTVKYNVDIRNDLTITVDDIIIKQSNIDEITYIKRCN